MIFLTIHHNPYLIWTILFLIVQVIPMSGQKIWTKTFTYKIDGKPYKGSFEYYATPYIINLDKTENELEVTVQNVKFASKKHDFQIVVTPLWVESRKDGLAQAPTGLLNKTLAPSSLSRDKYATVVTRYTIDKNVKLVTNLYKGKIDIGFRVTSKNNRYALDGSRVQGSKNGEYLRAKFELPYEIRQNSLKGVMNNDLKNVNNSNEDEVQTENKIVIEPTPVSNCPPIPFSVKYKRSITQNQTFIISFEGTCNQAPQFKQVIGIDLTKDSNNIEAVITDGKDHKVLFWINKEGQEEKVSLFLSHLKEQPFSAQWLLLEDELQIKDIQNGQFPYKLEFYEVRKGKENKLRYIYELDEASKTINLDVRTLVQQAEQLHFNKKYKLHLINASGEENANTLILKLQNSFPWIWIIIGLVTIVILGVGYYKFVHF